LRNTKFTSSRTQQSSLVAPRSAITVTIAIATALLAGCQSDSVVASPRAQLPDRSAQTALTAAVTQPLWNELTPVNGVLIGTPTGAVITPANDFIVPERTVWNVSSIVLRGATVGPNPGTGLTLAFRANGVGQPGALIQRFTLTAVTRTVVDQTIQIDFRFDLPQPVRFGPGTYWLVSQCSGIQIECGLGPVVGQQAFTTVDDGATWTAGFPTGDGPSDNLFALLGTEETPESGISDLEATVAGLGLDHGTETKLEGKLQAALADLGSGDSPAACGALQDFINLVSSKTPKKLTPAQAAALTASATEVRRLIGC
jgi:hypothetical protein